MSVLKALTRSSFSLFNYSVDCFLVFSFICASLTSFLSRGWIANCYLPVLCWQKTHPRVGGEAAGCRLSRSERRRGAGRAGPGRAGSTSETTAPSSARAESENKLQAALPPPPLLGFPSSHMSFLFCFPPCRPAAFRIRGTARNRRAGRRRTGIPAPRCALGPRPAPAVKLSRFSPRLPHAGC